MICIIFPTDRQPVAEIVRLEDPFEELWVLAYFILVKLHFSLSYSVTSR
jgi:hypothetical protein